MIDKEFIQGNKKMPSIHQTYNQLLFLDPIFTHNIWGGKRLKEEFGYKVEGNDIGECWGISAHLNGDVSIREGQYKGQTLSKIWEEHPDIFGDCGYERFPLLVKIIDAKQDLSIQVHPDDAYAYKQENGSFGKTECWYILDCPENATLVIGHNAKNKEELTEMIHQGKWKEFIREIPVKKGDFIQIDPGTVHAIKGGLLILETQQNSDITYRVYDYDRLSDGKPRQLHVEKSIDVITVPAKSIRDSLIHANAVPENQLTELFHCDYYHIYKINLHGNMNFNTKSPFMLASVIEGDGMINGQAVKKGDHFIVPNGVKHVEMQGYMELIMSHV